MIRYSLICFCIFSFVIQVMADEDADSIYVEGILSSGKRIEDKCKPLFFARHFIGTPYVGQTLDGYEEEQLIINTGEVDCMTFVENVVALSLCYKNKKTSFADFKSTIKTVRYLNGKINGYISRLHYFSEWIEDNERKGLVTEVSVTSHPLAQTLSPRINFMSSNPQLYEALRKHPADISRIKDRECAISNRRVTFIPKEGISDIENMKKIVVDGDIIAILTSIQGLDISHVGIAVWKEDGLHMIHASSTQKMVVEDTLLLTDYLQRNKKNIGVRVIRINY